MPAPIIPPSQLSLRDRILSLLFRLGLIGIGVGFVAACVFVPRWFLESRVLPVTVTPPGDVTRFDPVQALTGIKAFVEGETELISFDARFVRSDGTMDLTASYKPSPATDYVFSKTVSAPETSPPLGTGQTSSTWQQRVTVKVSRPGQRFFVTKKDGGMTLSYNYVTKGMEKTVHDAALTPVSGIPVTRICDLRDLWQQAILQGVPRDSVATIAYNGRDYRFQQYGNVKTYKFDLDCKLISK